MSSSRRNEKREDILEKLITTYSFNIEKIIDLSYLEQEGMFLEGTGSVVFDRLNKIFYSTIDEIYKMVDELLIAHQNFLPKYN